MPTEQNIEFMFPKLSWNKRSTSGNFTLIHMISLRERDRIIIPDFQRPLVWTEQQNIRFMESLILGLPVGSYCLHRRPDYMYELLDGQQRWNAVFQYVDNIYPVFNQFHKDLNKRTSRFFEDIVFPMVELSGLAEVEKLEAYNRLAYGGTPHS